MTLKIDSTNWRKPHRSKSFLASEVIREFVETNEWQIGEIQAALIEAEAGEFASEHDVQVVAKKWRVNAG